MPTSRAYDSTAACSSRVPSAGGRHTRERRRRWPSRKSDVMVVTRARNSSLPVALPVRDVVTRSPARTVPGPAPVPRRAGPRRSARSRFLAVYPRGDQDRPAGAIGQASPAPAAGRFSFIRHSRAAPVPARRCTSPSSYRSSGRRSPAKSSSSRGVQLPGQGTAPRCPCRRPPGPSPLAPGRASRTR